MVKARKQARGWHQRFAGFRVNCESVPCLPAWAVAWMLADPRQVPYLLVWVGRLSDATRDAVRVAQFCPPGSPALPDWVELKRWNGTSGAVRIIEHPLPRNSGKALLLRCNYCQKARHALYGWEADRFSGRVSRAPWQCRSCAGLCYASEGRALWIRSRSVWGRLLEREFGPARSDRPEPWFPLIFTSPVDAAGAGLCGLAHG